MGNCVLPCEPKSIHLFVHTRLIFLFRSGPLLILHSVQIMNNTEGCKFVMQHFNGMFFMILLLWECVFKSSLRPEKPSSSKYMLCNTTAF